MKITWSDILEIAIELSEVYPEIDPQWISFPDLHQKKCSLENLKDDPNNSSLIYTSPSPRDQRGSPKP